MFLLEALHTSSLRDVVGGYETKSRLGYSNVSQGRTWAYPFQQTHMILRFWQTPHMTSIRDTDLTLLDGSTTTLGDLAAGRAILSSDLPVIREILDDSSAAFAAPEDLASWSTALARLLAEPNLRASLSAHSAEKALQYSWRSRQGHCLDGLL